MSEKLWKDKTLWQKTWTVICIIWAMFAGIPTGLALIELFFFGIGINSFVFKPLMTPQHECKILKLEPEGNDFLTDLQITVKPPIYLKVLPTKVSQLYNAQLDSNDGFTFYKVTPSDEQNAPNSFERLADSDPSIAKSIRYQHRFTKKENYSFLISMSGPNLVEEECPFEFSVQY